MTGLDFLLYCFGIAVLAVIPLLYRFLRLFPAVKRRLREHEGRFDTISERDLATQLQIGELSVEIGELRSRIRHLEPIPPEMAQNAPESAEIAGNSRLGTRMDDFEAPDAPIDPMDGRVPYLDTRWRPPITEADLEQEDD